MVFKQFTAADKKAYAQKQAALKGKGKGKPFTKGKGKPFVKGKGKKAFNSYSK